MQVPTCTFEELLTGPHIGTFWVLGMVPASPFTQQIEGVFQRNSFQIAHK